MSPQSCGVGFPSLLGHHTQDLAALRLKTQKDRRHTTATQCTIASTKSEAATSETLLEVDRSQVEIITKKLEPVQGVRKIGAAGKTVLGRGESIKESSK